MTVEKQNLLEQTPSDKDDVNRSNYRKTVNQQKKQQFDWHTNKTNNNKINDVKLLFYVIYIIEYDINVC